MSCDARCVLSPTGFLWPLASHPSSHSEQVRPHRDLQCTFLSYSSFLPSHIARVGGVEPDRRAGSPMGPWRCSLTHLSLPLAFCADRKCRPSLLPVSPSPVLPPSRPRPCRRASSTTGLLARRLHPICLCCITLFDVYICGMSIGVYYAQCTKIWALTTTSYHPLYAGLRPSPCLRDPVVPAPPQQRAAEVSFKGVSSPL